MSARSHRGSIGFYAAVAALGVAAPAARAQP
ncbi:MAG: hypothetical protein JWM10_2514, partial [Myxococcaceae bacterium]|nr:hypothetical protein [Myxococcaceae bacterium]